MQVFRNGTVYFLSMLSQGGGAKPFEREFGKVKARMRFVDHHLAHAISAYAYSGFDEAAVVLWMVGALGKQRRSGTGVTAGSTTC